MRAGSSLLGPLAGRFAVARACSLGEDGQGWTWRASGRFPKTRPSVVEGWDAGGAEHGTSARPCLGGRGSAVPKPKAFALK